MRRTSEHSAGRSSSECEAKGVISEPTFGGQTKLADSGAGLNRGNGTTRTSHPNVSASASSSAGSAERRGDVRQKLIAPVLVREAASGRSAKGFLVELGVGGCCLELDTNFSVGTLLSLVINWEDRVLDIEAKVARILPKEGTALAFVTLTQDQQNLIAGWLGVSRERAWLASNRRRGQRVVLSVPVQVSGQNKLGTLFSDETNTVSVTEHGALLLLSVDVSKGERLKLLNLRSKDSAECVVSYVGRLRGLHREIGVSFVKLHRSFWHIAFPPADWSSRHPDAKGAK
jgi:hypothetical protein